MPGEGRLSGKRGNRIIREAVGLYDHWVESFVEKFLEDGYPMGSQPVDPRVQYERLRVWRDSGSPQFWDSPAAQQAFAELEQRFGGAPPVTPPQPIG